MIGKKTKDAAMMVIDRLFIENMDKIGEAHETLGELSIGIKLKLGRVGKGGTDCSVSLEFVSEKVKSGASFLVDEDQLELFPEE